MNEIQDLPQKNGGVASGMTNASIWLVRMMGAEHHLRTCIRCASLALLRQWDRAAGPAKTRFGWQVMNVSKNESQYLSQKDGGAVSSMTNAFTFETDPSVKIPGSVADGRRGRVQYGECIYI